MTSPTDADAPKVNWLTPVLFTITIFLSASLLFFVQPLFTKVVLPLIGGAPAVWATAMLFFQTVLIGGYLYAHLSTKYLSVLAQIGLHLVLWAIALLFLPLTVPNGWQFDPTAPLATQTLLLFALGVGMPFAVLSANAPLIQSWYANSHGPSADDPYFLYGASNLGSLIALLAFPLLAEPFFGAMQIGLGWSIGFFALGLFLGLSGLSARNGTRQKTTAIESAKPLLAEYGWWLLLAFIPSSLMLAITTKISTDLGSFPLVWVLPLSLFLLTFVLTFTNKPILTNASLDWLFILSLGIFAIILAGPNLGLGTMTMMGMLLFGFFFVAMKAHHLLYASRPSKDHLTIFYVTMSVGGALGGLFNSILAPFLFVELEELRVTILLAGFLLLAGLGGSQMRQLSKVVPVVIIILVPLVAQALVGNESTYQVLTMVFGILLLGALYLLRTHAFSCFVVVAAVVLVGKFLITPNALFHDRSFFGSHLVVVEDGMRVYRNGTTIHGAQQETDLDEETRPTPLYYYHPQGPMAQVLNSSIGQSATEVGIVGLGIGSLACYARPNQNWQFYEIDVMVDRIARDSALFTFMSRCAADVPTHFGDARVVLQAQTETLYDILVIDAYSSDAVPVHLMTNEAIQLYQDRLKDAGLIVLHISNRYYDLSRPLGRSAAQLGLSARIQRYRGTSNQPQASPSTVVVLAQDETDLEALDETGKWQELVSDNGAIWTDDYANLLSVLR